MSTVPTGNGFYVQLMGVEAGPHSPLELQQMVRNKQIKSDTPVRQASGGSWFPAANLDGLFSSKNYVTAMILSFFLGALGVDRFYLGYTGLGVLKLLTFGGCGIWALIDFINIAIRKMPDSDGLPLSD
jgi:TM2 domain/GYF domain 2